MTTSQIKLLIQALKTPRIAATVTADEKATMMVSLAAIVATTTNDAKAIYACTAVDLLAALEVSK